MSSSSMFVALAHPGSSLGLLDPHEDGRLGASGPLRVPGECLFLGLAELAFHGHVSSSCLRAHRPCPLWDRQPGPPTLDPRSVQVRLTKSKNPTGADESDPAFLNKTPYV